MQLLRHLLLAIQFFTRIPITGRLAAWVGYSPAMLQASSAWFPAIGIIVGGFSALMLWAAVRCLPAGMLGLGIAVLLCMMASVWLTGAFHEDGLADTADALGGHVSRERALEIMKDSRIGTYGTVALVLALLFKAALLLQLAHLSIAYTVCALLAAHTSSRFLPLFIIRSLPHVGDTATSKSKPLASSISTQGLFIALVIWLLCMAGVFALLPRAQWLTAFAFSAIALLYMRRLLQKRLGGFTGDGLGATQQVCELAFYLGLLMRSPFY